jgi:regulation of enolase protein 1 (concanavalin A-like superfamily)
VSARFVASYSQGGLIFFLPKSDPTPDAQGQIRLSSSPGTWIKAGIEHVDNELFASVAAGKPYSDWSLTRLGENTATFEMEKTNGSLWIYVTASDGRRTPLRKLTWVFDMEPQSKIWVGVAACMPKGDGTTDGGSLAVKFRDFCINTE